MKHIFLTLFSVLAFTTLTFSQDTKKHPVKKKIVKHSNQAVKPIDSANLSNRKIYHWKDGQRATPTGHNATPSNGSQYSALKKDTLIVPKKEKE